MYLPRCRFGFTAITSHPSKPELSKNAALPSVSQAPSLSSDHNYLPRKAFRCSTCLWPQECSNLQDKYKKVICDPAAVLRHQDDCCFHLFSSILKLILFPSVIFCFLLFVYKRFLFRYLTMVNIFLWEMCPKRQMRKNSGHSLASMAQSQNAPSSKTLPSVSQR